jgi:DNA helicase-2/ATP-dependent DNA helicase PcrA
MWKGDLSPEQSHAYLTKLTQQLEADGWGFGDGSTKVLMLTHRVLAKEQGYAGVVEALENADRFIQKQDPYIKFLVDIVEPVCVAYDAGRYGEMFDFMGSSANIQHHADKVAWTRDMGRLLELRGSGTVGDVIDHLKTAGRPGLPEDLVASETHLVTPPTGLEERELRRLARARKLRSVQYGEIVALAKFINEATPFSTKHGVKGAEFENVLVVFGRGWAQYDFNKLLEWYALGVPDLSTEVFERNRNLFYVACSRPKKRLAILFTQQVSDDALGVLRSWFGTANVHSLGTG